MRNCKFLSVILLSLVVLLGSCSDWLSVVPDNEQVSDEYWTSKEEVESVLASGYVYLRSSTENLINWGELRGGTIYNSYISGSSLQTFQINPDDDECSWASLYKVISMANSVLANAEKVQEIDETFDVAVMNSILTEAYFLRALSYFYIVRNWRDAPLILTPYENDKTSYNIAKSSEAEIIAQIKADINDALSTGAAKTYFSEDWETKGRATKWALCALMADVCLWSDDYANTIIYCNEILNASSSFRPVFVEDASKWYEMYYPGNSNESIFEIQWDQKNYDQTNSLASLFGNATPLYQYSEKMIEDFNNEIDITGIDNAVRTIYGGYLPNTVAASYKTATNGYVWKYSGIGILDQVRNTTDEQDPNFIIYRVADVMLMKAEAMILNSNSAESWQVAVDLINQIRVRSRLTEIDPVLSEVSEGDMLEYVLYERNMELAGEAKRWYDLLRMGRRSSEYRNRFLINMVVEYNNTANSAWIKSVLSNDDALYLPIHSDELASNDLLDQNQYYDIVK